jgi:hypothetical protein
VRRTLAGVFVVAALVAAYSLGQDRGITLGVEETTRFYWDMRLPCVPSTPYEAPIPTG